MDNNAGVADSLMQEDAPPKRAGGICAPWKWFLEKPLQRKSFIMFLIPALLTVVWVIMFISSAGGATAYILAGVSAILLSGLGANHFRILLALKEEVDKMSRLNQQFRSENMALQLEVDKLGRAREQLSTVEVGLKESNRKLKENVEKFRKLDENLKKLSESSIEGLEKLQKSSAQVMKTMQENLIRHEKQILMKVFDHLEMKDKKDGLSETEFDNFWTQMPASYVQRWKNMNTSFRQLADPDGTGDEVLDYDEFRALVDQFAEQEAMAGGSTFA